MNVFATAAAGISNAFTRFERASTQLVRATSGASDADDVDAVTAIVGQMEARTQLKANVHTLNVADEMLKELLTLQE